MRAHGSTTHPAALPILESLVRRAARGGDNVIPVRFHTEEGTRPASAPELDHDARATTTIRALERIFSEACPASLVKLARRPVDRASVAAPGLEVKIDLSWPPAPTWKIEPKVHAPTIAFEVTLRGVEGSDVLSFRLAMPPPAEPPTAVRVRSLFVVAPASDGGAGEGGAAVYRLLTARAFDRLYDEIYGLFFGGDPRVPLHEEAAP